MRPRIDCARTALSPRSIEFARPADVGRFVELRRAGRGYMTVEKSAKMRRHTLNVTLAFVEPTYSVVRYPG